MSWRKEIVGVCVVLWFVSQPADQCSHLYFTLFRPRQMGAELSHLEKLLNVMDLTKNSSDMSLSFFAY